MSMLEGSVKSEVMNTLKLKNSVELALITVR